MKQIVMHLLVSNKYSGAENVACQIIAAYNKDNNMRMFYCSLDGPIKESLKERNIPFIPLNNVSIGEVRRAVKEIHPTIIHAHDMRASFLASMAAYNIPLISHIHNNNFGSRSLSLKSILFRFAAFRARHIVWVSKNALLGYYFHQKCIQKSSIIYNVINIDQLIKLSSYDNNTYDFDIIYLGRFTYLKNPDRLIVVLKKVIEKLPNVKIGLIGDGDMKEYTLSVINKMDLNQNISYLGYKDNPYKVLLNSKVMIMTSRSEGLPMCALEALSLGVPLVSTPVGGICEIVEHGIDGFLSNDDSELADFLREIVVNQSLQKRLSDNAKNKMKKMMNMEDYKSKLDKIYSLI